MKEKIYFRQANLILDILPFIARQKSFALKGGTAINFFVRDVPRLSVDVDLCYLPITSRREALKDIDRILMKLKSVIESQLNKVKISFKKLDDNIIGLLINVEGLPIKIEPNIVIRGAVFQPKICRLNENAQNLFEKFVECQILSFADLYGGKICATLDRQHPRDLFDVKFLLDNEGVTDEIKQAFIVYLLSHPRPMIELLNPGQINISNVFLNEFEGMTVKKTSVEELLETRDKLIQEVNHSLSNRDRQFIASFKNMNPKWDLFPLRDIRHLPAIQWKLYNLRRMEKNKHKRSLHKLLNFLEIEL